jgi:gas vesicle protein
MPDPTFEVNPPHLFGLPNAPASTTPDLIGTTDIYLGGPTFEVSGYEYTSSLQPYVIEMWDEKSGDINTLRSVAWHYGINYQPGVGYASITNIKKMLRRTADHGKPVRILYVSDYDDAGQNMPVQVGRHSQFACWELAEVAKEVAPEIMVDNAALTKEQIDRLDLPPIPGTNKTEIDALEALHPGELRRILAERIEELQDPDLGQKIQDTKAEAQESVRDQVNSIMEEHREKLEEIQREAEEVVDRYRRYYRMLGEKMAERYRKLGERYERHIADLKEEAEQEHGEIENALESLEVDLPELPEAEVNGAEDTDRWLFDSRRDFLDQTLRFRRAKGME